MRKVIAVFISVFLAMSLLFPIAVQADDDDGLPVGIIAMWAFPLDEIFRGWQLCDGTNDTPDLLSLFVKGIPDDQTDPGTYGGNVSHEHNGVTHSHSVSQSSHQHTIEGFSFSTSSAGSHSHGMGRPSRTDVVAGSPDTAFVSGDIHIHNIFSGGDHSHTVVHPTKITSNTPAPLTTSSSVAANTEEADHIPPFFELAFICKVSAGDDDDDD